MFMRNHTSIKRTSLKKRLLSLWIALLITVFSNINISAQDLLFGFTGGLNMNTISSKNDDSGLKVGFNIGGTAQYKLNEKSNISSSLKFSTKGQQFSQIQENKNEYLKVYHSTSLYYADIPILYRHYIKDIVGFEIGPNFGFCLGGKDKSKIGNESWNTKRFENGTLNTFDFGINIGILTRDLGQSSFNNIFIEFIYYIGFTNVIKSHGRNTNSGVFLNINYIIEHPLKK